MPIKVYISEIAEFLGLEFYGENYGICHVKSLVNISSFSLCFSKSKAIDNGYVEALILVPEYFEYPKDVLYSVIKVKNPRLAFAKVVNTFFVKRKSTGIDKTVRMGKNCIIHASVSIGVNCVIGDNVSIAKDTILNHNIVLFDNTHIGESCYVKSGAIIGEDGFGFDFEEDGTPIRIPHIGSVVIGNDVEVGANTVIVRGTLNNTIIQQSVKIDDNVFIAHNCFIQENTVIIACAELSGSVTIGKNCWIGPNSSIIQKIKIGDNVTIGIGAIVTKDIEKNKKVMGLDALGLRELIQLKKRIEYGK